MTWQLTVDDLDDLARGATLLGTGGGGDPYIGRLMVQRAIEQNGSITIMDPDELPDEITVIPTAQMGAPTVIMERIPAGTEPVDALRALEKYTGRIAEATMPIECGGINSMIPLLVGAQTGLPVVDADGMGRAFPELQMETFNVYGVQGSPLAIADEVGHSFIVDTADDTPKMEWLARGATIRLGGAAHIAEYTMTGRQAKDTAVPRTITLALKAGRALRQARESHGDVISILSAALNDTLYNKVVPLFEGKVVDVERTTDRGFTLGHALFTADDGGELRITFQNENLVAVRDGQIVAGVPDLICVLEADTAEPITTERLRFGQRVRVIGISTPDMMRTPEALNVFGPSCFGLDHEFVPVEDSAVR
ncbi:DUF917 domain-containing protein [Brevibacterium sp. 50QC2O2]|uniref:DUF917 domain-containing protein n=1 Tax=Brevibacterium sp. 50QC2O2 TaxID=2968459 RepID=UPI00211CDC94|nr:DUF917 domain-containing protein [Brevibacterium sp. 50QC2O2]MCQ9388482.1 DUF917 domain-containing protein [Brevibacterium sp. 50QC2O2]